MVTEYDFHPFSKLFPLITGEEYIAFKSDIEAHGQRAPILLYEGKILDGRNRYRCCVDLQREPVVEQFNGDDALAHVLSLNLYRRQLNVAQRALIAAEFSSLREAESDQDDQPQLEQMHLEEASKLMAVSPRTISSACKVVREGAPELLQAVKAGEISISAAEQLCKLDIDNQRELCERGTKAIAKAAREIREESKSAKPQRNVMQSEAPTKQPANSEAILMVQHIEESTGWTTQAEQNLRQPSTQRLFDLAREAMEEGYEPETLVGQLLDEVEDGLDMQLLLFTAEAMVLLQPRLKARALRKNL